ncbi:MAG TPA: response regulator, partial [Solirubrobacterales bacterium]|nr:response regulator [Solirubrobacterales bacterium]
MSAGEARVLVVDDEPQIVRGLRVILQNAGYRVEEATTKKEALDAVSVRPPDAIVLDLVLPDGDGIEVTNDIRR